MISYLKTFLISEFLYPRSRHFELYFCYKERNQLFFYFLRDKVRARYFRKSIKGDLKGVIKKLFEFLEDSKVSDLSYWARLECFTEDTNEVTRMFSKQLLGITFISHQNNVFFASGNDLKSSLLPQSRKAIRYCAVEGMDEFTVTTMEKYVTKASRPSQEIFKVVSFCSLDSPHIVDRNVIYFKDETYTWQMLGSVDFAQHGIIIFS